jgi:hypothetical protein
MNAMIATIAEVIIATTAVLALVWAILTYVFVPHFRDLITKTVQPLLGGVPALTEAVTGLTRRMELMESAIPSLADTAAAAANVVATAAETAKSAAEAAAKAAEAVLTTAKHAAGQRRATDPKRAKGRKAAKA